MHIGARCHATAPEYLVVFCSRGIPEFQRALSAYQIRVFDLFLIIIDSAVCVLPRIGPLLCLSDMTLDVGKPTGLYSWPCRPAQRIHILIYVYNTELLNEVKLSTGLENETVPGLLFATQLLNRSDKSRYHYSSITHNCSSTQLWLSQFYVFSIPTHNHARTWQTY